MSVTPPIAAVDFLAPDLRVQGLQPAAGAPSSTGALDFTAMVSRGIDSVQSDWAASEASMKAIAEGQPVNLHQVMMRMEESRLSFQLFMQVRNRLLESYQDVMRMQV